MSLSNCLWYFLGILSKTNELEIQFFGWKSHEPCFISHHHGCKLSNIDNTLFDFFFPKKTLIGGLSSTLVVKIKKGSSTQDCPDRPTGRPLFSFKKSYFFIFLINALYMCVCVCFFLIIFLFIFRLILFISFILFREPILNKNYFLVILYAFNFWRCFFYSSINYFYLLYRWTLFLK
jgi:hypothetical protein